MSRIELTAVERAYADAINAANRVLFEAGFRDKLVAELGFVDSKFAHELADGKTLEISSTFRCPCYDCVSRGCNAGPCCCMGPAC